MAIPARPKDLRLDGVQPCSLFDAKARQELHVSGTPRARTTTDVYKAPSCDLDATLNGGYFSLGVSAITTEGIDAWLDGKRIVEAKLIKVGDYPAVTYYPKGNGATSGNGGCDTSVDVADGQQLMIDFQPESAGAFTLQQECQMTKQAAELAVANLQSQR